MTRKLNGTYIQSGSITTTQLSSVVTDQIAAGGGPRVTSLSYPGNDTAANTVGGQTVYIVGSGFETNNAIYINGNAVPSKSFISASNLSFTTPALSAGLYPVYVINTDTGATAIFVPGLSASGEPSWVTSAGSLSSSQDEASAWSYSLSATGDTPITYALASGSSLPTGVSLASNGVISGTISSPPGTDTTYTFSVVASDAQNQDSTRQFTVTTSTGEGVLFANNVLLIHADGTNNKNNHTFIDSSNNNLTITRNGNATQGTFSPFSQTGWSNFFDGSGDWLYNSSASANTVLGGSNDFTIEAWVYLHEYKNYGIVCGYWNASATQNWVLAQYATTGRLYFYSFTNGSDISVISTGTIGLNKWVHIAATRSGSSFKLFINGTVDGTATSSATLATTSNYFSIGGTGGVNPDTSTGYISNLRIIKGNALYTANFTPPTAALTAVSNTSILTCQSNRFIDNSNNAFALTRNGDVSVQPFSPFAPTAAYSTANVGGSGYFDGTGDYLQLADSTAWDLVGDFTIEMWLYKTSTASQTFFMLGAGGSTSIIMYQNASNVIIFLTNSVVITASTAAQLNTWNHVALVRSGSTITLYLNGTSVGQATNATSFTGDAANGVRIGAEYPTAYEFTGYISNLRIVKGTAVYTANFTPSTTPLTAIANTSLLTNFTNAGIFDQTAKNVLETVGDAKISTAQYKYGTGSIYIPGTNDGAKMTGADLRGDFTIEGWVKPSISGSEKFFIIQGINQTNGFLIALTTTEIRWRSNGQTDTTASISKSDWYHFAIVRSGSGSNNVKIYVDGSQVAQGTYANTILPSAGALYIGPGNQINASFASYGYIDDFRITQGYARYTSNFTAPTSALKDK